MMSAKKQVNQEKKELKKEKIEKYKRSAVNDVPLMKRLFAYAIDFYLGMLCSGLPVVLANGAMNGTKDMQLNLFRFEESVSYLVGAAALLFAFFYYVFIPLKIWKGQTVGKRLLHFKIVKSNGDDVSIGSLFMRQCIGMFLVEGGVITCSGLLRQMLMRATGFNFVDIFTYVGLAISAVSVVIMLITKQKKMLHDYIGDTTVTMLPAV